MTSMIALKYDQDYTQVFHSPGIEPWITGLLKVVRPRSVLDVGCGLGFLGVMLRGYLGVDRIVCIDVDPAKVSSLGVLVFIVSSMSRISGLLSVLGVLMMCLLLRVSTVS